MAKAQTAAAPLQLETKIPLGPVSGRIDHLAIDPKRQWLSVAELGNNSVGVIDVANRKLISTMPGFQEPQGIGYEPSTDTLYIANAGTGRYASCAPMICRCWVASIWATMRIMSASILSAARCLSAMAKARSRLSIQKPARNWRISRLRAHPESFQIEPGGARAFVNVPDAGLIQVVDLTKRQAIGALPTQGHHANFPMALDDVRTGS